MPRRSLSLFVALVVASAAAAQNPPAASSFQGTWKITTVIDDGTPVSQREVRDSLTDDGYVTLTANTITFPIPRTTNQKRSLPFVLDQTRSPAYLDVTTASGHISQGICQRVGNVMLVCLGHGGSNSRPTEFTSEPGSNSVLMILQTGRATPPPFTPVVRTSGTLTALPAPLPAPLPPPPPLPAVNPEEQVRKLMVGTWGHQNKDEILWATLNPDGSFSVLREPNRFFGKIFGKDKRSSGTWKYEGGQLAFHVNASDERKARGQVYSFRVSSIGPREVVLIDDKGETHREWKVR